ncbi:TetR/AcrR family transcriptional regulator [soil metagenome]
MDAAATDAVENEHYQRLLEGMSHAVAGKGYADTTIADIVREAAVSRRTFYEHFATKAECLIALYEAASHNALKVLQGAIDPSHDWQTQVEQALAAYLACMASSPVLMRTLFVEILGLGAQGLAARRRVNQEIADFMLAVINAPNTGRAGKPNTGRAGKRTSGQPLSPEMAMAVVGGINELVLQYIEQDRVGQLQELVAPASRLVRAAAGGSVHHS